MTKKTKFSPKDFYTRQTANEGRKLPLCLPDGTETEEYLLVRGVDSDEFRKAEANANFNTVMLMQKEKQQREIDKDHKPDMDARKEIKYKLVASLVAGWSMEPECTEENVIQLFREAPQIMEDVDIFANDRKRFFNKPSVISTPSQEASSN